MKNFFFLLVFSLSLNLSGSSVFADIPPMPDQQNELEAIWKAKNCNDPKNLVTCYRSPKDDKSSGCNLYEAKKQEYKWIATKSGPLSQQKFCRRKGLDK